MTTFRWYLVGLAVLLGAYVAVEYYRPRPLDWRPTLQNNDKIPYGTYVLFQELPGLLGTSRAQVQAVRVPIYSQIEGVEEDAESKDTPRLSEELTVDTAVVAHPEAAAPEWKDTTAARAEIRPTTASDDEADADYAAGLKAGDFTPATYLFVAPEFQLSRLDCRSLLRHVARGNDVLVAAEGFDNFFADTLGFATRPIIPRLKTNADGSRSLLQDSVRLRLSNPGLARQAGASFRLPTQAVATRLLAQANLSDKATSLATDERGRTVLLRVPHGRGHLYICTVPLAFSNYFVLKPRTGNFAFAALSYLPTGRRVWWDEYQKQGRRGEQSLLRVLMEHEALRYATYLALAAAVLFVAFEARRRQRVIPVLKPLPNTTLLFTRTVASLYRQGGNHQLIAEKKIGLFLEYLRTRYHEPGLDLTDEDTRERLAQKTGVPRADVDALNRRMNFVLTAPQVSDAELLALNKAINDFRKSAA
jgi:hypothetical protein